MAPTCATLKLARNWQQALNETFDRMETELSKLFGPGVERKSDFFRDLAGSVYMNQAEAVAEEAGLPFDVLINIYDKSIIETENRPPAENLVATFLRALERVMGEQDDLPVDAQSIRDLVNEALAVELEETYVVGHRLRTCPPALPEGTHPLGDSLPRAGRSPDVPGNTRTVLDIGGQDTKGIQIDEKGYRGQFPDE